MVTLTMSKIASIYSTDHDAIFLCQVEKNMTYALMRIVLPKCPKIGITVASLLKLQEKLHPVVFPAKSF